MKVICINNNRVKGLTIDRKYIITRSRSGKHLNSGIEYSGYHVINDDSIEKYYSSRRFLSIEDWRDTKLVTILD